MPIYIDKKTNRLFIKFDYSGVQYKKRLPDKTTKEQAKQIETKWRHQLFFEANGIESRKDITFEYFLADFFFPFAESHYSPEAFKTVEIICKSSLKFFKGKSMRRISVDDVEKFKAFRSALKTKHNTDRKPATVVRELGVISKVFKYAVKNEFLQFNPCAPVERPTVDTLEDRILTPEQIDLFLDSFRSDWARDVSVLILNTGLRQKDALGLNKFSVDFEQKEIRLVQGKTKRPVIIPLNELALAILEKRRANGSELFFPSPRTHQQGTSVKKALIAACERAKIDKLGTRVLRRTFGTMLTENNFKESTIAKLLGHADNRSVHKYQREKNILREAVESLENKKIRLVK